MDKQCVGNTCDLSSVIPLYTDTPFYSLLENLMRSYSKIRRVRRDGNCFYSSVISLVLEFAMASRDNAELIAETFARLDALLESVYPEKYIVEEFKDPVGSVVQCINRGERIVIDELDDVFWNYSTMYFRMITSGFIKANRDTYTHFVESGDLDRHCSTRVEVNNEYAGEVEITALTEALGLEINVICLETQGMQVYKKGRGPPIGNLLYMPEHFDIIYI